jgi:transcriptional regulator with XRE-family HTH domain
MSTIAHPDLAKVPIVVAGVHTPAPDGLADDEIADRTQADLPLPADPNAGQPLHRLGEARWQEGLSRRTIARRLGVSVKEVQDQEVPTADLPLSVLRRWQAALNVPMSELLEDKGADLSMPVELRAKLLKTMKTAMTILERSKQAGVRDMAQSVVDQLVAMMPELEGVPAWPLVGKRRRSSDLGIAAHRSISPKILGELE